MILLKKHHTDQLTMSHSIVGMKQLLPWRAGRWKWEPERRQISSPAGAEESSDSGVAGPERDHFLPSIPTFIELGYPQVALDELVAVFAPPGCPRISWRFWRLLLSKQTSDASIGHRLRRQISVYPLKSKEFFRLLRSMHEMVRSMADLLKPIDQGRVGETLSEGDLAIHVLGAR